MRARKRSPWRSMVRSMRRTSIRSDPIPKIMCRSWFGAAPIHHRTHGPYRLGKTAEDRLPDQEVADIELDHLGQRRDRLGGLVVESMAGMHLEAGRLGERGTVTDAQPFRLRR